MYDMATISEALAMAVQHHQAGRLGAAEQIYRQILAAEPEHVDALHLLGVIAHQMGSQDAAIEYISRAIRLNRTEPALHNNLGEAYRALRKMPQAVASYRRALELKPNYAEAHNNLGIALQAQGKLEEAAACYRKTLNLKPDFAQAHCNLGVARREQGKLDDAVACFRRVLDLKPEFVEAHNNLGNTLREQGKLEEAAACYRRALDLKPDFAEAHHNLGIALREQGKLDEAVGCFQRVLDLKPDFAEAHNNLGTALNELGKLDEAVALRRRALDLKPDLAEAQNNLGVDLKEQGNLDEAVACFRRAMELKPDFAEAHSNHLYTLLFCSGYDPSTLYEEHRRWNAVHAAPLATFIKPHGNDPSPHRRLRVGYVSPNFHHHPVGRFVLPLLESHDHAGFEAFCYASVKTPDALTDRCRARAEVWRDVLGQSDEQVACAIREDRIDILVDLTMHMAGNRLLVFARKPAPVQVTYLAYCGTTGLSVMDYRLTDPFLDPPLADEQSKPRYTEESIRLPETYWCYQPASEAPPVNDLPAAEAGHVTFGSLNNFCKLSPAALDAWIGLLKAIPGSRLLLHARDGRHRERVRSLVAEAGLSAERLGFVGLQPLAEYFRTYHRIDVALDPFPYGGGTTTCDALWMGVPVVSLAGEMAVGRGGLSILSNLGLADLAALDLQQYAQIAIDLAQDLPRLGNLRATLRGRLQDSPLMDATRFTQNVEAAYRLMWQRWCATRGL
jgi:protein O-GlcNAc transferase